MSTNLIRNKRTKVVRAEAAVVKRTEYLLPYTHQQNVRPLNEVAYSSINDDATLTGLQTHFSNKQSSGSFPPFIVHPKPAAKWDQKKRQNCMFNNAKKVIAWRMKEVCDEKSFPQHYTHLHQMESPNAWSVLRGMELKPCCRTWASSNDSGGRRSCTCRTRHQQQENAI